LPQERASFSRWRSSSSSSARFGDLMDGRSPCRFEVAELVGDIERALRDGWLPERKAVMQAMAAATSSRSSASRFLDHCMGWCTQLDRSRINARR
jgi:hypothetical protein